MKCIDLEHGCSKVSVILVDSFASIRGYNRDFSRGTSRELHTLITQETASSLSSGRLPVHNDAPMEEKVVFLRRNLFLLLQDAEAQLPTVETTHSIVFGSVKRQRDLYKTRGLQIVVEHTGKNHPFPPLNSC